MDNEEERKAEIKAYWEKANLMLYIISALLAFIAIQRLSVLDGVLTMGVFAGSKAIFEYLKKNEPIKINAFLLGILSPVVIIFAILIISRISMLLFRDLLYFI